MEEYCMYLDKVDNQLSLIGGKAYSLVRFRAVANVSNGFVVTTLLYESLIKRILLKYPLFEYVKQYTNNKLTESAYLKRVSKAFQYVDFDTRTKNEIVNYAKHIGKHLIVRSSATSEDSETRSFAGIFDSFLDVNPQYVPAAVKKVFESAFSPKAVQYMKENTLDIKSIKMACLVQEFLIGAKYGTGFFFKDKDTSDNYYMIEAVSGDPAGVTGGTKRSDIYIKSTKSDEILSYNAETSRNALFDFEIEDIIKLMNKIGDKIFPLDIEWAYTTNGLFLLQARKLTTKIPIKYGTLTFGCLPASNGVCTGNAVIYSATRSKLVKGKNKILVATDLPIEDSQIIKDYGGVILEIAGVTSHVAILAREYKIPCIVGLDNATKIIKPSERLKINGNTGEVSFLSRRGFVAKNNLKATYVNPENLFICKFNRESIIVEKSHEDIILHYNSIFLNKRIKNIVKSAQQKFNTVILHGNTDVWQRYWILLEVAQRDKKIMKNIHSGIETVRSCDTQKIDLMVNKLLVLAKEYYDRAKSIHAYSKDKKMLYKTLFYSYYAYAYWGIAANVVLRDGLENVLHTNPSKRQKTKLYTYIYKINSDESHPIHKIGDNIVTLIDNIYSAIRSNNLVPPPPEKLIK